MKIIPPKLKILAGFKADADVTIEQIIAALEKNQEGSRRVKFQSLMSKREQQLPNESFDARFNAVINSEDGKQLFAQMHVPESNLTNQSSVEVAGFRTKEEAKQAFLAHVEALSSKGLGREDAWRTAAGTEPGKSAYYAWKLLSAAQRPEIIRTHPPQPSESAIQKTREAMSRQE
jgi:hypothetical protein